MGKLCSNDLYFPLLLVRTGTILLIAREITPTKNVLFVIPCFPVWGVMVFNTTFNNIQVISCRSVVLMEETGENHLLRVTVKL